MAIWISRDSDKNDRDYEVYNNKPEKGSDGIYRHGRGVDLIGRFCRKTFERMSNIRLKPGELRRILKVNLELK